ncbi:MAG: glycosyltransferase [Ferruginibacter sp.]
MNSKPTILIVIDNFGKGGAEMLLVGIMPVLQQKYKVVLVILKDEFDFSKEQLGDAEVIRMYVKSKFSYLAAVFKLKKIIYKYRPSLIHAHLVYSSFVARIAAPAKIPLIFSVHNEIGTHVFKANKLYSILESLTIRSSQILVAVSQTALNDYLSHVNFKGKTYVLHNYIEDIFLEHTTSNTPGNISRPLKMLSIGNIKEQKNYPFLVKAFDLLKGEPVVIDVYGKKDTVIYPELSRAVKLHGLPIVFKGQGTNIMELLQQYDLFVMCSKYEGFGIAIVEAMAAGLPVMISDLEVLKEVAGEDAIYFNANDPSDFAEKTRLILNDKIDLTDLVITGRKRSLMFSKQEYIQKLFQIYADAIK